ncbi:acyl carrier protein [Bradyrhizobium japonicum]|uniref:Acyl carrier protein n=1 Tax=Bradyrhizobium japonicum TaxID=375 RepID=A0A0A3XWC2_BRAJP|nr:acyl carrier protein [Bradyrhizobium japonicum]KGT78762.1 acyl carrier protein [Bradyrhizobium japonicum]MCS3897858.1 acyl carrier protein [Bradyrhizobium japonicum USDA 38]MCS3940912.1 acyl carrier protein [Bradyrhizobium japonicum]MCW2217031.1 acyl carrier protein [Bradyrhizobium japonicum]MCW2341647.1 acyl carrier protein [Bradyrhizobium japonicum]
MNNDDRTFEAVKAVIVKTLGIEDRARTLDASTPLFGSMPELDSFAVVVLLTSLEEQFGFEVDGSEFSGEIFETVGTLAEFVRMKTALPVH